jgi:type VI secretion system protein VasG
MKGEFENRLKGVLSEIKASEKSIILFIDEAHTLVGAGGSAGSSDAANLLKPALARGEIRTCAATTWSEYKKYFEKDPALARRFQLVKLDEPSVETTTLILRGLKNSYEASHRVIIRDDAIGAAAELADRYISGRFLPDKAIDLIDTGCARIKVNLTAKPPVLEDKERSVQALEREKVALERDRAHGIKIDEERLNAAQHSIDKISAEAKEIQARWEKEKAQVEKVLDRRQKVHADTPKPAQVATKKTDGGEHKEEDKGKSKKGQAEAKDKKEPDVNVEELTVDKETLKKQLAEADRELAAIQGGNPLIQIEVGPDVLAQVVADWTGIPVGKMQRDQAKTVIDLEKHLKERIKGQDGALDVIAERIRASKAGIKNPNAPLGVFLLVGPSGVGKTETGLVVADQLFGGERNVVTVNMSEFQEGHTISRLIGSPPGYVGFGEGGMLTEAVRQQPYSVVLLDEIEKAHQEVVSLFYQVFDKGTLTDGEGKEINFRNTIIILTSNLATDVIQEMTSVENPPVLDEVVNAVRPILSKHFKPALLARMTVVPYYSLRPEAMKRIVEIKIRWLQKTLMDNNKITLNSTPAVVDQIAVRCTEVETGARNIEHILTVNVLPQLSRMILSNMITAGMPTKVKLDVGEAGAFVLTQEA